MWPIWSQCASMVAVRFPSVCCMWNASYWSRTLQRPVPAMNAAAAAVVVSRQSPLVAGLSASIVTSQPAAAARSNRPASGRLVHSRERLGVKYMAPGGSRPAGPDYAVAARQEPMHQLPLGAGVDVPAERVDLRLLGVA